MFEIFEALCKDHGKKPSTVARECGIDPSTISHWKKGLYTPKLDKLQKIADYFDVTVGYLKGEEPYPEVMIAGNDYVIVDSGELKKLIDVIKNAPEDVIVRLRYYAEGLIAGRKDS